MIDGRYDISLFHYRFSGELIGGVFVGFGHMEPSEGAEFSTLVVDELGWDCEDVTENDVCNVL